MSLPSIKVENGEISVIFYHYTPSAAAAAIFVTIFAGTTIAHVGRTYYHKAWHFIPLTLGMLFETIAYGGRIWSNSDPQNKSPWIMTNMLLYAAPVLLAATLYMGFGRLLASTGAERYSLISRHILVKVYVVVDIVVFATQIGGMGMQATGDLNVMDIGIKITAAGLGFQLGVLVIFGFIAGRAHWLLVKSSGQTIREHHMFTSQTKTLKYFVAVYIATFAIILRSMVRLIEFGQGADGEVASYEIYQYLFDAIPMWLFGMVFLWAHPGKLMAVSAASAAEKTGEA